MSTFLVSFGVVAVATVCVVVVALSDPDQPATPRRPTGRDRPRRPRHRISRSWGRSGPRRPARSSWRQRRPGRPSRRHSRAWSGAWVRVRSGLALVVLVAFVGVLMAVMVGTSLTLAARALQRAVG